MKANGGTQTVKTAFGKYGKDTEDPHASTLRFNPLAKNCYS